MAMEIQKLCLHHHRRRRSFSTITALIFLVISLFSIQLTGSRTLIREEGSGIQVTRRKASGIAVNNRLVLLLLTRRRLVGPGSSPPTCTSKCQRCSPCKPVRVPIQPGLTIPLEYYPEAWRCICANKLFMP